MIKPKLRQNPLEKHNEVFNVPSTINIKKRENKAGLNESSPIQDTKVKMSYTLPYIKQAAQTSKLLNIFVSGSSNLDFAYNFMQVPGSLCLYQTGILGTAENMRNENNRDNPTDQQVQVYESFFKTIQATYANPFNKHAAGTSFVPFSFRKPTKVQKFRYNDIYLFSKIMKNHDLTPFSKLLHIAGDSNVSSYPYFMKVVRGVKKTEAVSLAKLIKKPRAYDECSCPSTTSRICNREKPTEKDIKNFCDPVYPLQITEHKVLFINSYIIIKFEGVISYMNENKLNIRRGAVKFLKNICDSFNIIILIGDKKIADTIINILKTRDITISGLYLIESKGNKEITHFGRIYKDFHIKTPSSSVLVLASLNIEISGADSLFPSIRRVTKHINISVCPVSCKSQPITFLIPHILISTSSQSFDAIFNSFKLVNSRFEFSFHDWIKDCRRFFRVIRSTFPYEIIMETMPKRESNEHCRLHKTLLAAAEEIPFNYFVLFID